MYFHTSCIRPFYVMIFNVFPQATESLHRHTGTTGRDHRGLLENALGAQLYYCRYAHQASRNGQGTPRTLSSPLSVAFVWSINLLIMTTETHKSTRYQTAYMKYQTQVRP